MRTKTYFSAMLGFHHFSISEHADYRFGFNGMEKDDEISGNGNNYTASFWEYSPRIGRRWNLDPKPNPSLSRYSTFAGNPILYSDPIGDTIRLKENVSSSFSADFLKAYVFLKKKGASDILDRLQELPQDITIADARIDGKLGMVSYYSPKEKTIYWHPDAGLLTEKGAILTPAEILSHEGDHGLKHFKDPEGQKKLSKDKDADYDNSEERRVITGSEQYVARKVGTVKEGQVTRTEHNKGIIIPVDGPTSTEPTTGAGVTVTAEREK